MTYDPAKTRRLIDETDRMTTKGATLAEITLRNQLQSADDAITLLTRELAAEKEQAERYYCTLAGALNSGLFYKVTCKELREPGEKLIAERDALAAQVKALRHALEGTIDSGTSSSFQLAQDVLAATAPKGGNKMSATPICDAQTYQVVTKEGGVIQAVVPLDVAIKIERENTKLREDKARLDWFDREFHAQGEPDPRAQSGAVWHVKFIGSTARTLREAIDGAMGATTPKETP